MSDGEAAAVLSLLGAVAVAAGSGYQMMLAAFDERREGADLFRTLYSLTREEARARAEVAGLRPWSVRKRRALRREAKRAVDGLLAEDEGYMVRRSDQRGWAWSLVCAGSIALAVAAAMNVVSSG